MKLKRLRVVGIEGSEQGKGGGHGISGSGMNIIDFRTSSSYHFIKAAVLYPALGGDHNSNLSA